MKHFLMLDSPPAKVGASIRFLQEHAGHGPPHHTVLVWGLEPYDGSNLFWSSLAELLKPILLTWFEVRSLNVAKRSVPAQISLVMP